MFKSTCLKIIHDLFSHSAIAELLAVSKFYYSKYCSNYKLLSYNIVLHKLLSMLTFPLDNPVSRIHISKVIESKRMNVFKALNKYCQTVF